MLKMWFFLEVVNFNVEQGARIDISPLQYGFRIKPRDESQTVSSRIINGLGIWRRCCGRIAR